MSNLKVLCRVRPPSEGAFQVSEDRVVLKSESFKFDKVFGGSASQGEVFEVVGEPLVKEMFAGRSGSVFLFGTTGSGKSFNVRGAEGRHRGLIVRCTERALMLVQRYKERNLELKVSVTHTYMDTVIDLMTEKIGKVTQHSIRKQADLTSHMHFSLQNREKVCKRDPKIKNKSHLAVVLSLYEETELVSSLAIVELAGSENASSDPKILKGNNLTKEEKKSIAKTFNALSAVFSQKEISWEESNFLGYLSPNLRTNIVLLVVISNNSEMLKHNLACLRFSKRIFSHQDSEEVILQEFNTLYSQIHSKSNPRDFAWTLDQESALEKLKTKISNLEAPQKFNLRSMLRNLSELEAKLEQMREPKQCLTERGYRKQEPDLEIQAHLQRIESMNKQLEERDSQIELYQKKLQESKLLLTEKDGIIEELNQEVQNQNSKIEELNGKLQDYSKKVAIMKDASNKQSMQFEAMGTLEQTYEAKLKELEKKLQQQTELHQTEIQRKDQTLADIQLSHESNLNRLQENLDSAKQKKKQKTKLVHDKEKEIQHLNNILTEVRYKFDLEQQKVKKLTEESQGTTKRYDELNTKHSSLENKVAMLQVKNEELESTLNSTKQESETKKHKAQKLSKKCSELEKDLQRTQEDLQKFKSYSEEVSQSNHHYSTENERLSSELKEYQDENQSLKSELKEVYEQLEENNNLIKQQEESLNYLRSFQTDSGTLQSQLKAKSKKVKTLKSQIEEIHYKHSNEVNQVNQQLSNLEAERNELLAELQANKDSQEHELSVVENQIGIIEEELSKLREQNRHLQHREQEALKELRNAENAREDYKEQLIETKERTKEVESQLYEMESLVREIMTKQKQGFKVEDHTPITNRLQSISQIRHLIKTHRKNN